jgi:signal transduction histidine kinase
MTPRRPRSLRNRLTLVLAIGSLVLVVGLIGGFNVVLRNQLHNDVDSRLRERASTALANIEVRGRRVTVREAPNDGALDQALWVFQGRRAIESPRQGAAANAAAVATARRPGSFRDVNGLDLRLHSKAIRRNGRTIGAVVAGSSLRAYESASRRALAASVVLGLLVLAGVLAVVRFAIRAALRPVDRMTAEAAAWSIEDIDNRFPEAAGHDELSRLAATFNDLLARLAASFRHEQRFSAEVSHELRTPLAKLIMESELALRRHRTEDEYRAALESVVEDARQMQRVIETLLAVARSEIDPRTGTSDAAAVADAAIKVASSAGERGVRIGVSQPRRPLRLGVDADLAERVLAPVVANALQFAGERAFIDLRDHGGTIEFVVTDDGPGVPAEQREAIFAPGYRGSDARDSAESIELGEGGTAVATAPNRSGTGLGLALARRLARAAGGDVVCDSGGTRTAFVITLPSA